MARTKNKRLFDYVIYKGDDIICHGTKRECAEYLGVKEQTIDFLATPIRKKRDKGNGLIAEKVDISEDTE
ncbi:hypothetical protein ACFP67_10790 [Mammaliicoccus sciuri]|uniref:hypothetical protein n=1 Tax=Mammaliicoccus sciuri TaxID=1296 RepID=UPI000CD01739|nr:hypothetical protein [Mammaliicoccus sciuri]PNZ25240.1 hypothetical protein CD114_10900 [Mammaliicoccus sciuri]QQC96583.1 hypothetical protein JCQ35_06070 [Mammaliicoccus sciuri]